jgi:nicotinamidase-related amidase
MDLNAPDDKPTAPLAECDLPQSRTVLLLVDFINPLRFEGAEDIAQPALQAARMTTELKRQLAGQGVTAIYANDNYGQWRSDFRQLTEHCRSLDGVPGDMARLLAPGPSDLAVLKPRHSAFYATPLEVLLQQMHTRRLVITGLATDICVQMTAMDARLRGYEVWVPSDCAASERPEWHQEALSYLARVLRCDTTPSCAPAGSPEGGNAGHTDCP